MLPSFIIDQIRRREEQERDRRESPVIELPLPSPGQRPREPRRTDKDEEKRGVIIIDLRA